jgi:hypothetical protein
MSVVSNVFIFCAFGEEDAIAALNLQERFFEFPFFDISQDTGGDKYSEIECWAASMDDLNSKWFTKLLRNLPWEDPEKVLVVFKGEQWERAYPFTLENLPSDFEEEPND